MEIKIAPQFLEDIEAAEAYNAELKGTVAQAVKNLQELREEFAEKMLKITDARRNALHAAESKRVTRVGNVMDQFEEEVKRTEAKIVASFTGTPVAISKTDTKISVALPQTATETSQIGDNIKVTPAKASS